MHAKGFEERENSTANSGANDNSVLKASAIAWSFTRLSKKSLPHHHRDFEGAWHQRLTRVSSIELGFQQLLEYMAAQLSNRSLGFRRGAAFGHTMENR